MQASFFRPGRDVGLPRRPVKRPAVLFLGNRLNRLFALAASAEKKNISSGQGRMYVDALPLSAANFLLLHPRLHTGQRARNSHSSDRPGCFSQFAPVQSRNHATNRGIPSANVVVGRNPVSDPMASTLAKVSSTSIGGRGTDGTIADRPSQCSNKATSSRTSSHR